jgi:hypothetical protein
MISQSKQSIFIEPGKILINLCQRLQTIRGEKKRLKQKKSRIKMAVFSGSIKRVK